MALKDYVLLCLGSALTSELGWTNASPEVTHIVSETLDKLDLTSEPNSLTKPVKAVSKIILWQSVMSEFAGDIDVSSDGVNLKRSQLFEMAQKKLSDAYLDGMVYLPDYQISVGGFDWETQDPYSSKPYFERDL